MNYWLLKTEPGTYSWDDLVNRGTDMWDGVRNYQARNNLRMMKRGDIVFIYHSGKNAGIVGLAEITKEHYPDPTAREGDWSVVDVKPIRKMKRYISLQDIKKQSNLKKMYLVKNTRLSVQPVSKEEYETILKLENEY